GGDAAAVTLESAAALLLELVFHLGNASLGAGLLFGLATRCAAQADRPNRIFADHDRNSAAERNDVGKAALTGYVALSGSLRPLGRGAPERQRGIGLAAAARTILPARPRPPQ